MIQIQEGESGKTDIGGLFEYLTHAAASSARIFDWAAVARKKWTFETSDFQRVLSVSTTLSTQVVLTDPAMLVFIALQPNSVNQFLVFPLKQPYYRISCKKHQVFSKIISGAASLDYGSETSIMQVVTDASLSEEFVDRFRSALSQISKLQALEAGWDSYGAKKISQKTSNSAVLLLKYIFERGQTELPIVGPSPIGGVILQWNLPHVEIFTEIGPEQFEYYIDDLTAQNEFREGSTTDLRELASIVYQSLSDAAD